MLQGELNAYLGYKAIVLMPTTVETHVMEVLARRFKADMLNHIIEVPHDRNSDFEPVVEPKHQSCGLSIERLVIFIYAKGISVSDIEDKLWDIYKTNLYTSAISIFTNKVTQAASKW